MSVHLKFGLQLWPRTVKEMGEGSSALDMKVAAPARLCLVLALADLCFSDLLLNLRMHRFTTIRGQKHDCLREFQGAWCLLEVDQGIFWWYLSGTCAKNARGFFHLPGKAVRSSNWKFKLNWQLSKTATNEGHLLPEELTMCCGGVFSTDSF